MYSPAASKQLRQTKSDGNALVVFDAHNRLEQQILDDWLRKAAEKADIELPQSVSVSLGSRKLPDDLTDLSGKLNTSDGTQVAPVRVFWSMPALDGGKPPKLRQLLIGNPRRPGPLRGRYILWRHPERVRCLEGEPATIGELRERFDNYFTVGDTDKYLEFARFVAKQASVSLDLAERKLHGNRYKVPRFVAYSLITSKPFRSAVAALSDDVGKPVKDLLGEARGYMKELIAVPNALFIDIRARLEAFVLGLGYEKSIVVDEAGLEALRKIVREKPVALLWTHKTHMDGAALSSVLYKNDFPIPHMFGGINMSVAGLGFVLRRSGAIFIRRSFQDNALYKLVLRHYVGYLLEKRFPLTWAFEGTRSRVGKLMPPRFGLFKYFLDAARATGTEDLHFVPVAINYDLIREIEDYAAEQAGERKQPESLKWFIGYARSLKRPMGRIYMNFGEPVVVPKAPDPDDSIAIPKIAFDIAVKTNKVSPITMPSLACLVLLRAAPRALTIDELQEDIIAIANWAIRRRIPVTSDFDMQRRPAIDGLAKAMVSSGPLSHYDQGSAQVYGIDQDQYPVASYYRNTIVHHFVNKAIVELALLRAAEAGDAAEAFWEETEQLRDLFKFEFFYPPSDEFQEEIRGELTRSDKDWEGLLSKGGDACKTLLDACQPLVAHAVLQIYVEAYTVVIDLFARLADDATMTEKDCVAAALKEGKQALLQRRVSSEASIGKLLFKNAFKLLENLNLVASGDGQKAKREHLLREFLRLGSYMDRLDFAVRDARYQIDSS